MRLIKASQATAAKRRVYFHLVATDGVTPATGEAGGQPQISTNGGAWTNTGIGTLAAIGNGRYYADLTVGAVATSGDHIETRYKSAGTAECPGDSAQVVTFDPDTTPADLQNLLEADWVIDTGVTPWACVLIKKSTGALGVGTELLRQVLRDVSGNAVTATSTIVGRRQT